jgi:hypothetical protein
MGTSRHLVLIVAVAFALGGASRGQEPLPDDPEAVIVGELLVQGRMVGPAWWLVSDEDSEVWIFGTPAGPVPRGLAWDAGELVKVLGQADTVLASPGAHMTLTGVGLGTFARTLPGAGVFNSSLESELPDDLSARFRAVRENMGYRARRYANAVPLAGLIDFQNDVKQAAGLASVSFEPLLENAQANGARVVRAATYEAPKSDVSIVGMDQPAVLACVQAVLDEAEAPADVFAAAARGWAEGDTEAAMSAPRDSFNLCMNMIFGVGFSRYSIAVQTDGITAALERPGTTLALVPLRQLLAEDGVIFLLREKGFEVIEPDQFSPPDLAALSD